MELLSEIGNKLENFEIDYYTMIKFLNKKENEDAGGKLLDIIYYIYLKEDEKSKRVFSQLKTKTKEIQKILDKYEKILKIF